MKPQYLLLDTSILTCTSFECELNRLKSLYVPILPQKNAIALLICDDEFRQSLVVEIIDAIAFTTKCC